MKRHVKRARTSPLARRVCLLAIERGGVTLTVGDVPATQAVGIAVELLRQFRKHETEFPALVQDVHVTQIGGYHEVAVTEDEGARSRKVGF